MRPFHKRAKWLVWLLVGTVAVLTIVAVTRSGQGPNPQTDFLFACVWGGTLFLLLIGSIALVFRIGAAMERSIKAVRASQRFKAPISAEGIYRVKKNFLQITVFVISLVLILIGLRDLISREDYGSQLAPVGLCAIGLAGIAFLAWLKC
ncbi:MAG TPA: hypothetical protein VGG49_02430 [Steroidobacteraceae bacterium]|jgi:uncharacterized membrane protein